MNAYFQKDTNKPPKTPLKKRTLLLTKKLFHRDPALTISIIWNKNNKRMYNIAELTLTLSTDL